MRDPHPGDVAWDLLVKMRGQRDLARAEVESLRTQLAIHERLDGDCLLGHIICGVSGALMGGGLAFVILRWLW